MPQIKYTQNSINIELSILEKILSMHGDFEISFADLKRVEKGKPDFTWREMRIPGTYFPGIIKAGTYLKKSGAEFWYVSKEKKHALTIFLNHRRYQKLVLGFETASGRDSAFSLLQNVLSR